MHKGTVIDLTTRDGIAVEVRAYASVSGRKNAACPTYDKEIQSTVSQQGTGEFQVTIPADVPSYVLTYCRIGVYESREEQSNQNAPDAPVRNAPIEMQRTNTTPQQLGAAIDNQIRRLADTLAYLERSNPGRYNEAVAIRSGLANRPFELKSLLSQLEKARSVTVAGSR